MICQCYSTFEQYDIRKLNERILNVSNAIQHLENEMAFGEGVWGHSGLN